MSAANDPATRNLSSPPDSDSAPTATAVSAPLNISNLEETQLANLIRSLPDVFSKLVEQGGLKEAAAETLSNLSQATFPPAGAGVSDPGPSSHPRGPPNLGQPAGPLQVHTLPHPHQHQHPHQLPHPQSVPPPPGMYPPPPQQQQHPHDPDASGSEGEGGGGGNNADGTSGAVHPPKQRASRTNASGVTMGSDEWSRQRKDNHKEVERRRRGNINEGINELARIVPNGTGEKAKGAILSRAVQYIHHLKENEARNIEKWTLEKLLMDQAMGDLQAQLEEVRRMWEEERMSRSRAESELDVLRGLHSNANTTASGRNQRSRSPERGTGTRASRTPEGEGDERGGKRQRVE